MPATPTPIFGIPGPVLSDNPPDIEVAFDPLRDRLEELFSALAAVEIGVQLSYAGTVLPDPAGEVEYAWANGSLIDRTVYDVFFTRVGHSYNGGLDPGGNQVRLPDKRGRFSVGADEGSGRLTVAGLHNNVQGQNGGSERIALATGELPVHTHTASQVAHRHGLTLRTSTPGGDVGSYQVQGTHGSFVQGTLLTGEMESVAPAITVATAGSGGTHDNMGPYEVDRWIVRIR